MKKAKKGQRKMDKKELDRLEKRIMEKREIETEGELCKSRGLSAVFPKTVLASRSPRRIELIQVLGFNPTVFPSGADENTAEKNPVLLTQRLAFLKAEEVQKHFDDKTLIIGADTVVFSGEKILGKPRTEEDAYRMLYALSGREHTVYTGVCLLYGEKKMGFCERTVVQIAKMSEQEIRDYIATGDPMDKAGAYGIQGEFSRYVRGIVGDYYNVVGLPVSRLYQSLKIFSKEI